MAVPRAVFRTQPKVYEGAFFQNSEGGLAVNFFSQKNHHKCLTVFQKCLTVAYKKRSKLFHKILILPYVSFPCLHWT